jgi:hypothetical protein
MKVRPVAAGAVAIVAIMLMMAGTPARAQFGGIFDPPRPPGDVPGAPPGPPPATAPSNQQLLPPGPPPRSSLGRIQSEDLPPLDTQSVPRPGALPPPGQRPQRAAIPGAPTPLGAPASPGAPPAAVAAAPPEDVITPPPPQRIANPTAVFAGLDKITGRITAFDTAIGETVQFGALQVTARACYSRPPTETPLTDGFVEVDEVTLQGEVRRIFTGWMFAASPGLHAVEHAIYDVWLTDCKGGQPVADAQPAPARTPASAQRQAPQRAPAQAPGLRQTLPPSGTLTQPGPPR